MINKFRGKRIDNGEWVYGYLVKQFGVFKIYDDSKEDFGDWIHEVIPETVGQFTGLTDRFGFDIYKGDLLQVWRSVGAKGQLRGKHIYPLPVEYCTDWASFVVVDKSNKIQYIINQQFGAYEIVGNILEVTP
jgi:hypothetical protein